MTKNKGENKVLGVSNSFNPKGYNRPYRLVAKISWGVVCVHVQQFFEDTEEWFGVPSGWRYQNVLNSPSLTIDGGQKWVIDVPKQAWDELIDDIINTAKVLTIEGVK